MASPFTVFRKHQKILIATLGLLAMIAFVFLPMMMSRACLAVKQEKILPAIPRLDLIGNPEFDQPRLVKITQPKIPHQGLHFRQRYRPRINLPQAFRQGFLAQGPCNAYAESFAQFVHARYPLNYLCAYQKWP